MVPVLSFLKVRIYLAATIKLLCMNLIDKRWQPDLNVS